MSRLLVLVVLLHAPATAFVDQIHSASGFRHAVCSPTACCFGRASKPTQTCPSLRPHAIPPPLREPANAISAMRSCLWWQRRAVLKLGQPRSLVRLRAQNPDEENSGEVFGPPPPNPADSFPGPTLVPDGVTPSRLYSGEDEPEWIFAGPVRVCVRLAFVRSARPISLTRLDVSGT